MSYSGVSGAGWINNPPAGRPSRADGVFSSRGGGGVSRGSPVYKPTLKNPSNMCLSYVA